MPRLITPSLLVMPSFMVTKTFPEIVSFLLTLLFVWFMSLQISLCPVLSLLLLQYLPLSGTSALRLSVRPLARSARTFSKKYSSALIRPAFLTDVCRACLFRKRIPADLDQLLLSTLKIHTNLKIARSPVIYRTSGYFHFHLKGECHFLTFPLYLSCNTQRKEKNHDSHHWYYALSDF